MNRPSYSTIDEYIADHPADVQAILEKIRRTIRRSAPKAEETIGYQIPAFKLNGKILVYFAAFKNHVGVYPAPRGEPEFKDELGEYKGGKGTIQFPLDKPINYDLIRRIVRFKVKKDLESATTRSSKR